MKHAEAGPVVNTLKALEESIKASEERLDEVLQQRKTYDQMAKRLRSERQVLDPQMRALERALQAKGKDLQALVRVSHDAAHAKDAAKAELARTEASLAEASATRAKQLADRKALWRVKQELADAAQQAADAKAAADAAPEPEDDVAARPQTTESQYTSDEAR